jgi:hypothetical protein
MIYLKGVRWYHEDPETGRTMRFSTYELAVNYAREEDEAWFDRIIEDEDGSQS